MISRRQNLSVSCWLLADRTLITLAGTLIAFLFGFCFARGTDLQGLQKRYFIYFVPLLPLVAALTYRWMSERMNEKPKTMLIAALALIWVFSAFNYCHGRHFDFYKTQFEARTKTVQCVHEKLEAKLPVICTYYGEWDGVAIWTVDLSQDLVISKRLGLSFIKDWDTSYLESQFTEPGLSR